MSTAPSVVARSVHAHPLLSALQRRLMQAPIAIQPSNRHIQMNLIELLTLAAIWGASFLFMRVAVPELGPIPLIALRVAIAALVLAPVLRSAGSRRQFRSKLWPLFVVGVTNSAVPFCLTGMVVQRTGCRRVPLRHLAHLRHRLVHLLDALVLLVLCAPIIAAVVFRSMCD
ncbi:hypothetical protein OKW45_006669 [Paraburkholderia sp. WSM4175]